MSPQLAYCADASAILSYQKCKDDRTDEHGWKKMRAGFAKVFLSSAYRKAKKRHPKLDQTIARELARLQEYESSGAEPSADIPAGIFGDLMKAVFSDGLEGTNARLAAEIGHTIGRWIYLVDAADDFEEDRKKHRFNPFLRVFGDQPTDQDWELIRTALTAILCETERAFLLFDSPPCPELKEILANILYCGLPQTALQKVRSKPLKSPDHDQKGDRT